MTGDFTGFSFDGIHSSSLNIIRVSSGDRYNEELQSDINDKTVEIPGNNGEYYYWSTYGPKTHSINIAFDSVTEKQFRQIRQLFGTKKVCPLIFDERPYKVYMAKLASPIELEYVCFDEEEWYWESEGHDNYIPGSINHKVYTGKKRRIYKGEGTIELVSYYPFAHQLYKVLDMYGSNEGTAAVGQAIAGKAIVGSTGGNSNSNDERLISYDNVDEWAESSGLLTRARWNELHIDELRPSGITAYYNYFINVYNPGDFNTGFCLYIPFDSNGKISPESGKNYILINCNNETLCLSEITRKYDLETGVVINTRNHLIEGVIYSQVNSMENQVDLNEPPWELSGRLYNEYIKAGDFPYIKRCDWLMDDSDILSQRVSISCSYDPSDATLDSQNIVIHYNYLYF